MKTHCSFAFPGTFGHECGAPAVTVGIMKVDNTKSGIFFARRCANCAKIKGGENRGVTRFEPFNPELHVNVFK